MDFVQQRFIDYYEILQVHPKASQEVIQNSYRTLAKKFHPDIYPDKDTATKIMALINDAYSILADTQKRKQYDELYFIKNGSSVQKQHEASNSANDELSPEMRQFYAALHLARSKGEVILEKPSLCLSTINGIGAAFFGKEDYDVHSNSYITQHWFTILFFPIIPLGKYRVIHKDNKYWIISKIPLANFLSDVVRIYVSKPASLIAWCFIFYIAISAHLGISTSNSNAKPPTNVPKQSAPLPAFVPKNDITTCYVPNEPTANNEGYCTVTIDNKQNTFPVIVRLWSISSTPKPVRTFTIKQGEQFTAESISPGDYEVRYMHLYENIQSTDVFKTAPFLLRQYNDPDGVRYETVRFTLYKVPHGNAKTYPISVNEL